MTKINNLDGARAGYSVAETAAFLGRTEAATRQLIRRGIVPSVKVGGSVLVPAGWLDLQRAHAEEALRSHNEAAAKRLEF